MTVPSALRTPAHEKRRDHVQVSSISSFTFSPINMYVYTYIYIYIYIYVCVHLYMHMYTCLVICICLHIGTYMLDSLAPWRTKELLARLQSLCLQLVAQVPAFGSSGTALQACDEYRFRALALHVAATEDHINIRIPRSGSTT